MLSSLRQRALLAFVLLIAVPVAPAADEPAFMKKTYPFKRVGDVKIEADVYRADDAKIRPVLVWIHGGALVMGSRSGVPGDLLDLARKEGYCLISIDYRLAPEAKVPAIIDDVKDFFRWLRSEGPKALHIDPNKVVVSGGSAGGYLTMMTGICVEPRPTALVGYWGYGDVDGDWYTKPSEHYRKASPLVSKEDAHAGIGKLLTGTVTKEDGQGRGRYYLYLRQNGLWTREVTGFDPATETKKLDPYCPVRNISASYPPILMIHGTADTDVPHEKSADMAKELERHKVPHEFVSVANAGHGLSGGDKQRNADARAKALAFIRKYLQ
jgi:acetyl esterase/lipase